MCVFSRKEEAPPSGYERGHEPVRTLPVAISALKSKHIPPAFVGLTARPRASILSATARAPWEGRASGTKLEAPPCVICSLKRARRGGGAGSAGEAGPTGRCSRAAEYRTRRDSPRFAAGYRTRPIPASAASRLRQKRGGGIHACSRAGERTRTGARQFFSTRNTRPARRDRTRHDTVNRGAAGSHSHGRQTVQHGRAARLREPAATFGGRAPARYNEKRPPLSLNASGQSPVPRRQRLPARPMSRDCQLLPRGGIA